MGNGRLLLASLLVASGALAKTELDAEGGPASRVPPAPRAPGEVVAEFALPDLEGRPASLRDYVGRSPVLVVFYRGFW